MTDFVFTPHALKRMNQRGITREMLELALEFGQHIWAKDTLYVFMGKRQAKQFGKRAEKLEGITVVIESKTMKLKTIYRNRSWTKKIRHKK